MSSPDEWIPNMDVQTYQVCPSVGIVTCNISEFMSFPKGSLRSQAMISVLAPLSTHWCKLILQGYLTNHCCCIVKQDLDAATWFPFPTKHLLKFNGGGGGVRPRWRVHSEIQNLGSRLVLTWMGDLRGKMVLQNRTEVLTDHGSKIFSGLYQSRDFWTGPPNYPPVLLAE